MIHDLEAYQRMMGRVDHLTSSANPSTFGQPVTFTAAVTSTVGTPSDNGTFSSDGNPLGTVVAHRRESDPHHVRAFGR